MKIDYRIIEDSDVRWLERGVREAIAEGWVPLGGVSIAMCGDDQFNRVYFQYAQAMTRGMEDEEIVDDPD